MLKFVFLVCLSSLSVIQLNAQLTGCTDPLALNYDAAAQLNDGSCLYPTTSVNVTSSLDLPASLQESSGLIFYNNAIWSHNDNSDLKLYQLNPNDASQIATQTILNCNNTDWEEITQDANYIYIGDFGNNSSGNRTDLHILRIAKNSLFTSTLSVDTIWFTYSNQTDFSATSGNNTNFDCEAFIVSSDSIYLFTKQWLNQQSTIYALPKLPGTYSAQLKVTIPVNGLITGANFQEDKRLITLIGYSSLLQPFLYLLYDFQGTNFESGNKRKVGLNLPFHQTEGITSENGIDYYVSNEYFSNAFATTPQKLHTLNLSNFLQPYINSLTNHIETLNESYNLTLTPNPTNQSISIHSENLTFKTIVISTNFGKIVQQTSGNEANELTLNVASLLPGSYFLSVISDKGVLNRNFIKL
ncbi:MAG: T9SS type A sorting domain-containing protein [Crocinitomicaceae bacterium]|nr:T9SS type A sorting domain-containing protein [Crocinitomicaceae bacterium]